MEPRIEIRSCREEDLDQVCAIEERNFPSPNPRWWFERILFRKPGDFLVAVEGEDVLGFAATVVEMSFQLWRFSFGKQAHLMDVAVREDKRREGVGTALLKSLADRMEERGVDSIRLEVRARNVGARKFYRSSGFREEDFAESHYSNGDDAVKMKKDLPDGKDPTS